MITQKEIHDLAVANGFWDDNQVNVADFFIIKSLALIHSEISEAIEGFRNNDDANLGEELSDAVIRIMDLAEYLGIDLQREITRKHHINQTRPFRHGKKF